MASGRLIDYLGSDVAANRPVAPTLNANTLGLFFATDTGELSAWDGTSWVEDIGASSNDIGSLPAPGALTGAELLEMLQGGVNKQLDIDTLAAFIRKRAVAAVSSASGTLTLDCSAARNFTVTLTENITSIVLTNLDGAGFVTEIEVEFKQDGTGGFTVALPETFKALGGSDTSVASAANAVTVLSAKTFDNGTAWRYAMQESV